MGKADSKDSLVSGLNSVIIQNKKCSMRQQLRVGRNKEFHIGHFEFEFGSRKSR